MGDTVTVPRKLLTEALACMRATGWQLAPGCAEPGSDGVLETACAEVEMQVRELLAPTSPAPRARPEAGHNVDGGE